MTTNRIVINAQTTRHEHDRLVAVARHAAKQRHARLRVQLVALRVFRVVWAVVFISALVLAVIAAFGGGVALVVGAI